MEDSTLIYVSDCYEEGEFIVVRYEDVVTELVAKISKSKFIESIEEKEVRFPVHKMITSPSLYIDRFFLFEGEFDIDEYGFKNTVKGGNDSKARSLRGKLRVLNERAKLNLIGSVENEFDTSPTERDWYVCIFNVGNGESNLVVAPNGSLYLFDGGCLNQNICKKIDLAISYFKSNGINVEDKFSGFFISHCDGDHFRGVIEAMENVNTTDDCFVYYNYLSSYSKPSWVNAVVKIDELLSSNKISNVVLIPRENELYFMNSIIPSLHTTWMWPYKDKRTQCVSYNVSSNDSSHCLYLSDRKDNFSINFFGDAEKIAGDKIIYDDHKMIDEFIFKPSHHGRKSGNIMLNCIPPVTMHEKFDSSIKVKSFVSSTKLNKHLTSEANLGELTESASTAVIVKFSGGKTSLIKI